MYVCAGLKERYRILQILESSTNNNNHDTRRRWKI